MAADDGGVVDPYQFLEDFERKASEMQQQLEQSQEAMANARSEASSDDGTVTVAVAGGGSIQSIDLTPKSLELGHTKLASTIMATIHKAQAQAARELQESMRPLLGDGDAMSFLGEQVEAGIARLQPEDDDPGDSPARRQGNAPEMDVAVDDYDDWNQRRRGGRQ